MTLPFSEQQFFDVFGSYNSRLWPVVAVLWIATLWLAVQFVRGHTRSVAFSALLAFHWAWSGLVYHASFFSAVNPAARLFGVLFAVESVIFLWLGVVRRRLEFEWAHTARHAVAGVLIAYSLAYPILVLASGLHYPRAPLFAVPCPTTLLTCGVLMTAVPRVPRVASVVPLAWTLIAGSAAFEFGVVPDAMLFVAGAALAGCAVAQTRRSAAGVLIETSGARRS